MSEKTIKTQKRIIPLIWLLFKKLIRYGNKPVYYHIPGGMHDGTPYYPLEVEGVEVRKDSCNDDIITIW